MNGTCRQKTGGNTALHLAAIAGDRDIAELLVTSGAAILATDNRNCTPLHMAAQYDSNAVMDILLKQK